MTSLSVDQHPVVRQVRASSAQEGRWRGSVFDVVNRVYRLRGPLSVEALGAAVAAAIERHESLRCSLREEGELVLRVHRQVPPALHVVDAEGATRQEREEWLEPWLAAETSRPFDRLVPPLLRATLVQLDEQDHVLVIVVDHIISDGWSVEVLATELATGYRTAVGVEVAPLDPVHQYPDWAVHERAQRTEELLADRTNFWRDRLPGGPQDVAVRLSGYREPEPGGPQTARTLRAVLDADLTDRLRRAARELRVTLNVLTSVVLVRLLQRDTGQERITLSTSSASRFAPETASMIGYLASTIWIPTTLGGESEFPAAARAFQQDLHAVMARADVPARYVFERLWGAQARTLMDAVPQVGFLCTPFWGESFSLPGVEVTATEHDDGAADGALSVYLTDRGSRIEVEVRVIVEMLADGYVERVLADYVADLTAVAAEHG